MIFEIKILEDWSLSKSLFKKLKIFLVLKVKKLDFF